VLVCLKSKTAVSGTPPPSPGSLTDVSSDVDESQNWSLGKVKVGDASPFSRVSTQTKARSETKLLNCFGEPRYKSTLAIVLTVKTKSVRAMHSVLTYFLKKQLAAVQ